MPLAITAHENKLIKLFDLNSSKHSIIKILLTSIVK